MTKIIWVRGGLVHNSQLAEAVESLPERECMIIKVESVQEAIVELYEGEGETALIICDKVLEMSVPRSELRLIATNKRIPYLVNEDEGVCAMTPSEPHRESSMFETQQFKRTRRSFMARFMENLHVSRENTIEHLQAL